jgi:ribonuclease Z
MKTFWKRSAWIGGGAVLAAAILWWQRGPITVGVMTQQINSMTAISNPLALLADGLHVGLCGAGSPFPDTKRSGPCTVVVAGRRMFVFDSGSGASRNIARMRLNSGQIEALSLPITTPITLMAWVN